MLKLSKPYFVVATSFCLAVCECPLLSPKTIWQVLRVDYPGASCFNLAKQLPEGCWLRSIFNLIMLRIDETTSYVAFWHQLFTISWSTQAMTVLWPDNISVQQGNCNDCATSLAHPTSSSLTALWKTMWRNGHSTLTKPPNFPGRDPRIVPRCQVHYLQWWIVGSKWDCECI